MANGSCNDPHLAPCRSRNPAVTAATHPQALQSLIDFRAEPSVAQVGVLASPRCVRTILDHRPHLPPTIAGVLLNGPESGRVHMIRDPATISRVTIPEK